MNVLQSQPPLSISTNQCKKQFLTNEIYQMESTKEVYLNILQQLKSLLRQASSPIQNSRKRLKLIQNQQIQQTKSKNKIQSLKVPPLKTQPYQKQIKNFGPQKHIIEIKNQIQQFTTYLQNKIRDYCSSQILQKVVKYLQIQTQQSDFHPLVIKDLNQYIKAHEKLIAHRERQLQNIEDIKCSNQKCQNKQNKPQTKVNKNPVENNSKTTQNTQSSFDVNRKIMEVVQKQIALLKIRKRKLQIQIQDKKNRQITESAKQKTQKSQTLCEMKRIKNVYEGTTGGFNQQIKTKRLPALKNYSPFKTKVDSKKDISAFEKTVLVYQKDRFINNLMQHKISKLQKKMLILYKQNSSLKQKTLQFQKQIQKMDWHSVCDRTFVQIKNKKLDKILELSILDRTDLGDDMSMEHSKISLNQSVIKRF